MEDPKLLGLLEQFITGADSAFTGVAQQLVTLAKEHFKGDSEEKRKELRKYLTKRLLDGTTSDEPKVQDRYLLTFQAFLRDAELLPHFDSKETLQLIDTVCAVANAINKTERKFFAHAHLTNLLSFFLRSKVGAPDFVSINPQLTKILSDPSTSYSFASFLAALRGTASTSLSKADTAKVLQLLEGVLSHHKPACETFRQAALWLEVQNVLKTFKLQVDSGKFEALEAALAGSVTAKGIGRLFEAVVVDDAVNTGSECGFFESVVVNIVHRNNDKALLKLLKSLHNVYDAINKDKAQRQKKAFHLVSFMKSVFRHIPISTLLDMDLESVLSKRLSTASMTEEEATIEAEGSNTAGEIIYDLINFWQSQIGNKNVETKMIATEFDHQLAAILKDISQNQGAEAAAKLSLVLLKVLKHSPSNPLRGGDLQFMHTALSTLYKHEKSFNAYLAYLQSKVKVCTRVAALNFYLNELEHLGQVSLGAKAHKSVSVSTPGVSHSNPETNMRLEVVKALIQVFLVCKDEASLAKSLSQAGSLDWNDQELSFKKFRGKSFERVLNLIFKRDDSDLLLQSAEVFAKAAAGSEESQAKFLQSTFEAGKKILKRNPEFGSLLLGLVFQNFFEAEVDKNTDIITDLVKATQFMVEKAPAGAQPVKKLKTSNANVSDSLLADDSQANKQSPQDVFVDSIIALCSTSVAQLKPLINKAFESAASQVTKVGLSLLFQAVTRPDSKYLMEEEGEEDEEALEGEEEISGDELEAEEEAEDVEEEKLVEAPLGKRPVSQADTRSSKNSGKANGQPNPAIVVPNLKAKVKA